MIENLRAILKKKYEEFVEKYGFLNKTKNKNLINRDIYGFRVLHSLEKKIDNTWSGSDVLERSNKVEHEELVSGDCVEALAYVLGMTGRVSLSQISSIVDKEIEECVNELGDHIFMDPSTDEFVPADKYLSGNVVQKLAVAQFLYDTSTDLVKKHQYNRSLKDIKQIQPTEVPWPLLTIQLGERWLNQTSIYDRFASWLMDCVMHVRYLPGTDKFKVEVLDWGKNGRSKLYGDYYVSGKGRTTLNGVDLLEHALENTSPIITYGNPPKQDNDAIQLAQDKIESIRKKFTEFLNTVIEEEERDQLTTLYNKIYNCYVLRKYDGSHLSLPGIDMEGLERVYGITEIRNSQKNAAWRIIQGNGAIIDHQVGCGKSLSIVIAAHEMNRMKIRRKPAILCLKANVGDIAKLYRVAYPQAKVLAPGENGFEAKNRKRLFHEIKNNDWDCVIMTHDQFGKIPQSEQIQQDIIQEELDNLERDLNVVRVSRGASRTMLRGLQIRINTLKVKLKAIQFKMDTKKDDDICFDDMGIDHLMVDECFPYDTPVLTDIGWLPIGEIVEKRKKVNVLSYCEKSRIFELMPAINWLKKPLVKKLVKITHEYGELTCTEDHKIWTIECGYIKARELTPEHTIYFTPMSNMWESVESETKEFLQSDMQRIKRDNRIQVEQTTSPQRYTNYFTSMSKVWGENKEQITEDKVLQQALLLCNEEKGESREETDRQHSNMSMVWEKCSSSQEEQILQCNMQDGTPESATTYQRTETSVWKRVLRAIGRRQKESKNFGKNESQQSNAQSGAFSQNDSEYAGKNISVKRRKWSVNSASDKVMSSTRATREEYGMGDIDQSCERTISLSTISLQGRYRDTGEDAVNRSGWENTSNKEVEVPGQTQNSSVKCSRVVSIEIYQRASDAGHGFSDSDNNFVYDLTVEKNHNYFADGVLVSNCHHFKNLLFTTRHDRVAGLGSTEGSQKALNMLYAIRTLQKRFDSDMQATFLSGTVISNSLTELYLLFKYLRPRELAKQSISNFDSWAAVYAVKTTDFEFSVTNEIIAKERFRHFIKVPELALFYNEIADYQTNESMNIDKPELKESLVPIPPTPDQQDFIHRLVKFATTGNGEWVFRDPLSEAEDRARMLLCTNYAKKMSTDMRLIDPDKYGDDPGNKISICCKDVAEFYDKFSEDKGTQLIFCDLGTPNSEKIEVEHPITGEIERKDKWNVYRAIKDKLVEQYLIPANEIAFIHDYNERTRPTLFKQINEGIIRILIGSTQKAGTGVNIQQRVVAIYDLDIPWKPAELEQRGGRAARTGNWLAKLKQDNVVYRRIYGVERSLDAYKFTLLKNKQIFISQMKTNDLAVRTLDEGSFDEGTGMNFAEYIALLSGDTSLLEKAKVDKKLTVLESLKEAHYREQQSKKNMLVGKTHRREEIQETVQVLKRDLDMFQSAVQLDKETGYKLNPIKIYAIEKEVEQLVIDKAKEDKEKELFKVAREQKKLSREIAKQERQLLRSLGMKRVLSKDAEKEEEIAEVQEQTEETPKDRVEDSKVFIGKYLMELHKNWKPAGGVVSEVIGELYGFKLCIKKDTASNDELNTRYQATLAGINILQSNKFYAEHPDGGLHYTHDFGGVDASSFLRTSRLFINALSRIEGIYKVWKNEDEVLAEAIEKLSLYQAKPFEKGEEIEFLRSESKRMGKEIEEKILHRKAEPVDVE